MVDATLKRDKKGELAMSKLVIMGTIEVQSDKRDEVVPLLTAHGARCLKDEPGTLEFKVLIPRDDDTKILIYEVYQDDAAFEVHRNGPSIARWRNEAAGMVVKVVATRCTPVE